jgi:dTDP-4-amino-4,6-dideoxygalactose transaminase
VSYRVPFVDPREHYRKLKPEIDRAFTDTLATGDLVLRRQLVEFEANLAAFVGTKYAVGVSSGYHALHLSLLVAGIGPGDEVIVPAHTFVASVSAIVHCGATPVLVDVGPDFNVSPPAIEAALTKRTRAVMPVHLNGRLCDMDGIMALAKEKGLVVIEDACQGLGATFRGGMAGSFGLTGCFSFYPFKALGGIGDGGAVTTNDPEIARKIVLLRYNGEDRATGEYHYHGYTALLDNVQAAILDVKLRHLPAWVEHRRMIAAAYHEGLRGVGDLQLPDFDQARCRDSFQNYVIRSKRRDELRAFIKAEGVETLVHWSRPMWAHPGLQLPALDLPETLAICRESLSLPMSAETTTDHVAVTVEAIRQYFGKTAS